MAGRGNPEQNNTSIRPSKENPHKRTMADKGKGKEKTTEERTLASGSASAPTDFIPEDDGDHEGFFSVNPKMDCPHIGTLAAMSPLGPETIVSVADPCCMCQGPENWLCLKCHRVFCSR